MTATKSLFLPLWQLFAMIFVFYLTLELLQKVGLLDGKKKSK